MIAEQVGREVGVKEGLIQAEPCTKANGFVEIGVSLVPKGQ